jgi:pyridoxine kinase
MQRVLILSSHVAASRVGGFAQSIVLATLGYDPVLAPTVLFGRHPGWGAPGGAAVDPDVFRGVLTGIRAQEVLAGIDAVITGYFAHPEQVAAAAEVIDDIRAARQGRPCFVLVDPVLGDTGKGLYVKPAVADAVADLLVSRADLLTPNLWELGHLAGRDVSSTDDAIAAALSLGRPVLVTSAPPSGDGDETIPMSVLDVRADTVWRISHGAMTSAPNGTGDLLAALLAAAVLDGLDAPQAARRAVAGVMDALIAADGAGLSDLPLASIGVGFRNPVAPVTLARHTKD